MNKLSLTIIAFAALSGAAYANDRVDVRDSDTCFGKYCNNAKKSATSFTLAVVSPLAIDEKALGLTSFERMKKMSEENSHGRH